MLGSKDLLDQLTAERVLARVATRRRVDVAEHLGSDIEPCQRQGPLFGVRVLEAGSEAALAELMARETCLDWNVAVVMVEGIEVARQRCVAALVFVLMARRSQSGCGWVTPRTRPSSLPCPPTSPPGASTLMEACSWSSTGPRP